MHKDEVNVGIVISQFRLEEVLEDTLFLFI